MAALPPIRLTRVKPSAGFRMILFLPVAVPLLAAAIDPVSIGLSAIWGAILYVYPQKGR